LNGRRTQSTAVSKALQFKASKSLFGQTTALSLDYPPTKFMFESSN
jgi:hypothetical protein